MGFLPNQTFQLSPECPKPSEGAKAVVLEAVTDLPGNAHEQAMSYTVLCAECIAGDWVWATPHYWEKQGLGALLVGINATEGQWYYLVPGDGPYEMLPWGGNVG